MRFLWVAGLVGLLLLLPVLGSERSLALLPPSGENAPHVVLLSGDEEYRSEESLPMLAHILTERHGFRCTVLFALDPDGTINPDNNQTLSDAHVLTSADAIVMALRWRDYPDEVMQHFVAAYHRGVPIIALRTSTHAFRLSSPTYASFNTFGKEVLGEDWVDHWGHHNHEATRTVIESAAREHPLLRGVGPIFGPTDVYEVYPPADVTILLRGEVVAGMEANDPPATHTKSRQRDGRDQPVNDPMMPVAWTRIHRNPAGSDNRVFVTTLGASVDLEDEDLRRLMVNAVYWAVDRPIPSHADVRYVRPFKARYFGSGPDGFRRGLRPADYEGRVK